MSTDDDGATFLIPTAGLRTTISERGANVLSALISPEEASHVLWHFRAGDREHGSFFTALVDAIAKADPANRLRLAAAFPGECAAMDVAQNTENGLDLLRRIAGIDRG